MNWIEAAATVFGMIAVWLIIRRNILCWPAGLIQVLLYIYIFLEAKLYSDMILHVIYVFLQIYGWYNWLQGGMDKSALKISVLSGQLLRWISVSLLGTYVWGSLMGHFTDASVPYLDAFTTVVSLAAQWLMVQKKLESWLFWIAVDIVAIGVYWYKELYLTTGLYVVFLVMSIIGYYSWKQVYQANLKKWLET